MTQQDDDIELVEEGLKALASGYPVEAWKAYEAFNRVIEHTIPDCVSHPNGLTELTIRTSPSTRLFEATYKVGDKILKALGKTKRAAVLDAIKMIKE